MADESQEGEGKLVSGESEAGRSHEVRRERSPIMTELVARNTEREMEHRNEALRLKIISERI